MSTTESPAVLVARFLKANHYNEVEIDLQNIKASADIIDLRSIHQRGKS